MPKNKKIALEWKKKYGDNNFKQKLFFLNKIRKIAFYFSLGFFYHGNGFRNSLINPLKKN